VLLVGVIPAFAILRGEAGHFYEIATDYAATLVFLCMMFAIVRRTVVKPARYEVPAKFGKAHKADAIFLLSLIALLMFADSLFEAAKGAGQLQAGELTHFSAAFSYTGCCNHCQMFPLSGAPASLSNFCCEPDVT